jgi:nickel-dependent lactate racemase
MRVRVGYGLELADYDVPEARLVTPQRQPSAPAITDLNRAVHDALETPIGFPALRKALTPDDQVVIVADDHLPRQEEMLSAIVQYLIQTRIQPTAITILYPAAHKSDSEARVRHYPGIRVEVHDSGNRKKLSYLATTRRGRRLYLNRTAVDADQLIVLSIRGYDPLLGYSGTAGALFPGLSDAETKLQMSGDLSNNVPDQEPWPARREAEEVAWLLGAPFMVQVIEGSGEEIVHVLGGLADTSVEGERLLDARWRLSVNRRADVVVAGISGDPARHGIVELARALACAVRVVKPRGRIVLLSQAQPELGPGMQILRNADEPRVGLSDLRRSKPVDMASAFQWASAAEHANIFTLSRLEPDVAEELFTTPLTDPGQVVPLLQGADVLFLDDAHKSIAVAD